MTDTIDKDRISQWLRKAFATAEGNDRPDADPLIVAASIGYRAALRACARKLDIPLDDERRIGSLHRLHLEPLRLDEVESVVVRGVSMPQIMAHLSPFYGGKEKDGND